MNRTQITDLHRLIAGAQRRLERYLSPTPLRRSEWLSEALDAHVWLKLECVQPTGSFKVRGALNAVLLEREKLQERWRHNLDASPPVRAVAASTGNHGAAVAWALKQVGGEGWVFVPETASPAKIEAIESLGVEVKRQGGDGLDAERAARAYAMDFEIPYISPYNDLAVVAGQGTLGLELEQQLEPVDWVFASVGGGGLLAGTAGWLKRQSGLELEGGPGPKTRLVGSSPAASRVMIESIRAGRVVERASQPTLSDGTAGGVEPGAVTFDLLRAYVDDFLTVEEEDIAKAVRDCLAGERLLIEGSAGVAIASALAMDEALRGRNVVIVLCGANISAEKLRELI